MVIKANIAGWEINRLLIDYGSSTDIIFVNVFDYMQLSRRQLKPSDSPLMGLYYPYNAIFGRGFANKFNAAIHMGYLCMKMPALHGIITIHGSQKEARNIERAIYKSQRNINSVESAKTSAPEPLDMPKGKIDLKDQEETKSIPLENAVPDRKFTIRGNLSNEEEAELIETLAKNKDVFTWSAFDSQGVKRDIIQHSLDINPKMKPKKQRQRKMSEDRIRAAKAEVQRLQDANVIREVKYSEWMANVVLMSDYLAPAMASNVIA
ncbi:uncharacterized protein [Miscanthus floridulus]|uniref:uncharacterized protein n=1 Tax=Miscanthus floridulus TaxID=154761 RepID=UPI003459AEAA